MSKHNQVNYANGETLTSINSIVHNFGKHLSFTPGLPMIPQVQRYFKAQGRAPNDVKPQQ